MNPQPTTVVRKFLLLLLLVPAGLIAQGSVRTVSFMSAALGATKNMQVVLPQGYDSANTAVRYPVVYFLHGAGGSHTSYGTLKNVVDSLISNQLISPIILVKPDGSSPPYAGSFYSNSALYGRFEDYIVNDLIAFIDSTYNTRSERQYRSIIGQSMGAYGAMKLGLKHPDKYRSVGAHSCPMDFNHIPDAIPYIKAELGGTAPYIYNPTKGSFNILLFSVAGALSPNMAKPPYYVDLPLDSLGNLVDSVMAKWQLGNPSNMVKSLSLSANLAIYFTCGDADQLTLYGWNTGFVDTLNTLGIPYRWEPFQGGHSDKFPSRAAYSLQFIDSVMKSAPTSVASGEGPVLESFSLEQNYPNPFNPATKISFTVSRPSVVSLKVYSLLGSEVATLISGEVAARRHEVEWNAAGRASGIYMVRLQTPEGSFVRRMVLMR